MFPRLTMIIHIALLRAINVGGHNLGAMSDLRQLFADLGFPGAKSLLQSGNVVFESPQAADAEVERRLEKEIAERLGGGRRLYRPQRQGMAENRGQKSISRAREK